MLIGFFIGLAFGWLLFGVFAFSFGWLRPVEAVRRDARSEVEPRGRPTGNGQKASIPPNGLLPRAAGRGE